VFVPRDRYDSDVRRRIGDYLAQAFHGRVSAFYPYFPESSLVRVHFIIGRDESAQPDPDRATLEAAVNAVVRTWSDDFSTTLAGVHGTSKGRALLERYGKAFSEGYRAAYTPADAVADIRAIERLSAAQPLGVDLHERGSEKDPCIGLKVWS